MSKIIYFLREAFTSSRRNPGTAIGGVVTIFLSLLMVGVSIMLSLVIGNVASSFESEVNVRLYVSDSATDAQINTLTQYLTSLENDQGNIASVSFRNKAQVLEDFQDQTKSNPDIVKNLDGNPLPRTYVLELRDTQKVEQTVSTILSNKAFTSIADDAKTPSNSVKYGQGTVDRLFMVTNIVRYVCFAVVLLLVFISLVFLNNTIRLAILARSKEIKIMRLVGASNGFIRGPFIMEGALQAFIGAVLAIFSISCLRAFVMPNVTKTITFLPLSLDDGAYTTIYLVLIIAGIFIGVLGSAIAMRRYLEA